MRVSGIRRARRVSADAYRPRAARAPSRLCDGVVRIIGGVQKRVRVVCQKVLSDDEAVFPHSVGPHLRHLIRECVEIDSLLGVPVAYLSQFRSFVFRLPLDADPIVRRVGRHLYGRCRVRSSAEHYLSGHGAAGELEIPAVRLRLRIELVQPRSPHPGCPAAVIVSPRKLIGVGTVSIFSQYLYHSGGLKNLERKRARNRDVRQCLHSGVRRAEIQSGSRVVIEV